MRIVHAALAAMAFCAAAVTPCWAEDQSRVAVMNANIERALQSETNTTSFWTSLGNGSVREKRSGMICRGEISPDMPLEFLSGPVPVSPMSVVGCIYRSADRSRVVHVILAPNMIGAAETRKMTRLTLNYTDKEVVSLGATPIEGVADSEEEAVTSVFAGKPRLNYLASGTAGNWLIMVRTYEPRPEAIDVKQVRSVPVAMLAAAIASITSRR